MMRWRNGACWRLLESLQGSTLCRTGGSRATSRPEGVQLGKLKSIFGRVIAGNGDQLFSDAGWSTLCSEQSTSWSQEFAHLEEAAQEMKLGVNSFRQDVEHGLVWLDFASIPQTIDADPSTISAVAENWKEAVQSIPSHLERCACHWVLTPAAHNVDRDDSCSFSSWRRKGWCRVEEWANFLSISALMSPVVSENELLSTYSMHALLHVGQHWQARQSSLWGSTLLQQNEAQD